MITTAPNATARDHLAVELLDPHVGPRRVWCAVTRRWPDGAVTRIRRIVSLN